MDYSLSTSSFTTLLSFPILFLVLAITLFSFIQSHKNVKQYPLPPGPRPWPIVGCLPAMLRNKPAYRWIHNLMKEMNSEIACIRLGNIHVIPVTCPNIACEFLKAQDDVFSSRPQTISSYLASNGYLSAVLSPFGDQWKKMKLVLATHVLSPRRHQWLHKKRVEEADNLVRLVYKQCQESNQEGMVNLRFTSQHYCANVIKKLMFNKRYFGVGMENGGPGFEDEQYVDALFTILNHLFSFCVSDFLSFLTWLDLDGHEEVMREKDRIIRKYHDPIIDDRIQQWKDGKKKDIEDLLDVLITLNDDNGNPLLSRDEIRAQVEVRKVVLAENGLRFISFSTGKRGCMAVTLGSAMTNMLFARLLQGFSWSLPSNEPSIDLSTAGDSMALAKPLLAAAKPRLPAHLYPE
ncbi:hypothetical protein DKX38_005644 [Salix brachista]|uniref:Cytochrome P450 n=1 Tax=Salix brachista TaxID=2182728 RepID=A0A5N5N0B4_9ROSI|nr:hypothetical protein DKX38_005644 [Salix brachista]